MVHGVLVQLALFLVTCRFAAVTADRRIDTFAPYHTEVSEQYKSGRAPFTAIAWLDVAGFFLPIYDKNVQSSTGYVGTLIWLAAFSFWLVRITRLVRMRSDGGELAARMPHAEFENAPTDFLERQEHALRPWLRNPGAYASLDVSVSFYLLLTASGVFLSGLYTKSLHAYADDSLFGEETYAHTAVRCFCSTTALTAALLLVGAQDPIGAKKRKELHGLATLCTFACVSVYFYLRAAVMSRPHKTEQSLVAVDWALFAILTALSARSCGVPEYVCSCWLRKFIVTTMALMYMNAGMAKLQNSGLTWVHGDFLASEIKAQRSYSLWPWLNDFISNHHWVHPVLGGSVLTFEFLMSFMVAATMLSPLSVTAPIRNLLNKMQLMWALCGVAFHFGIFLLMFPFFMTYTHVIIALVLDPFAPLLGRHLTGELLESGEAKECRGEELPLSKSRNQQPWPLMTVVLCALLIFCAGCWVYVGLRFPTICTDPIFPFTSMPMYSEDYNPRCDLDGAYWNGGLLGRSLFWK